MEWDINARHIKCLCNLFKNPNDLLIRKQLCFSLFEDPGSYLIINEYGLKIIKFDCLSGAEFAIMLTFTEAAAKNLCTTHTSSLKLVGASISSPCLA